MATEIKKVFKQELAIQLIKDGHRLIHTEPNTYKPTFSVYCFEATNEMLKDLTKLTNH